MGETEHDISIWMLLRHPIRAFIAAVVAGLGMMLTSDMDRTITVYSVRNGDTATSHKLTEGYE